MISFAIIGQSWVKREHESKGLAIPIFDASRDSPQTPQLIHKKFTTEAVSNFNEVVIFAGLVHTTLNIRYTCMVNN